MPSEKIIPVKKIMPAEKIKFASPLESLNNSHTQRQQNLDVLKKKFSVSNQPIIKKKSVVTERKKTIKIYKLGKNKKKNNISVLIKSNKTRKKIKDEIDILKQKSISEIKLYLKKHNIIKIGSMAPDTVLRQLYKDSRLAGDIYNNSSENLMHNYINDK